MENIDSLNALGIDSMVEDMVYNGLSIMSLTQTKEGIFSERIPINEFYKENIMENQHRKITGYRELTQEEIDLMNEIKEKGLELEVLAMKLNDMDSIDKRWLAIGKTELQQGLMAWTRSVAKPEFF